MRKSLITAGFAVGALMILPTAFAGGPNGGWGKGLLSSTLDFYVGSAEDPTGFMYWNPVTDDFIYDFHGYYLESGTVYYLICYEEADEEGPDDFLQLGSAAVCTDPVMLGVHIKGVIEWPSMDDVTVCLVPETWEGLDGDDPWAPDEYLMSQDTIDL